MEVNNVQNTMASARSDPAKGTEATANSQKIPGRSVGQPSLSQEGLDYYKKLREKHSDMEFVLVSKDKKQEAQARAASFAQAGKTVVLIDEEKIERMAVDENYRNKYEKIIGDAKAQIPQLKEALANQPGVKGFGIQINDGGTASFFAVLEKSNKAQMERMELKAAQKKADKKLQTKKDAKKAAENRRQERLDEKRKEAGKSEKEEKAVDGKDVKPQKYDAKDYTTIEASSIEELLGRIQDYNFLSRSDSVMTEAETYIGGSIDFKG